MAIQDEAHKAQLAAGRQAAKAVRAYLEGLEATYRGPGGNTRSIDELKIQRTQLKAQMEHEEDPLKRLSLMPKVDKIDMLIKEREAEERARETMPELIEGFVEWAKIYGDSHGIKYEHWTQMKVPAEILAKAGIER